jgi:uncharacterized protein YndB with AHSA1/START domain
MPDTSVRVDRVIRTSVTIDAPIERVWAAFAEAEHLARWYPDRVEGAHTRGGRVLYAWDTLGMELALDVLEAEPPHRLALRAQPPGLAAQTQWIELSRAAAATRVEVVHAGFDPGATDVYEGTASGWQINLATLALYAERYFGQPRLSAWFLGLVPAPRARVYAALTDDGLDDWLTESGVLPAAGQRFDLSLRDGPRWSGEVLVRSPPRDVLATWDQAHGAVAFRQFTVGDSASVLGIHLDAWSPDEAALEPGARALEASLDRLVRSLGGSPARA